MTALTAHSTDDWDTPTDGDMHGYIQMPRLRELWIHTGTACNLACPFCLEGSKPGDKRLQLVRFADVRPFIDEAISLGTEQFSFTGGEPFLARDLPRILNHASALAPCLVLTNGTRALQHRLQALESLRHAKHTVSFRVSLDYPDAARHDNGRGPGMFHEAMQGLKTLHGMGFHVSVARQWSPDEDSKAITTAFRQQFLTYGLPADLPITWFPDFSPPGSHVETPRITEHCMTAYHTAESRAKFMCAYSRMIVKQAGRMRVYACTLVDDDPDYDMGSNLADTIMARVRLRHHRCYSCFRYGASCSESP